MALRSITTQRRRLADEVYDQLVAAILSRDIGPDDRLVQEKLASELDISRTPVREALLRLEKEGVLHLANSGGFRLAKISEEETRELYQARAAIEGQAARILASRNVPAELEDLRVLIRDTEDMSDQRPVTISSQTGPSIALSWRPQKPVFFSRCST